MEVGARRAEATDLVVVVDLQRAGRAELIEAKGGALWAAREARPQLDPQTFDELLAGDRSLVVVGQLDGVPFGYAVATIEVLGDGSSLAVLSDVFVEAPVRGVGIGEEMVDAVIAWATAAGCRGIDAIALPGTRDTKNFFERMGLVARAIVVHRRLERSGDDE